MGDMPFVGHNADEVAQLFIGIVAVDTYREKHMKIYNLKLKLVIYSMQVSTSYITAILAGKSPVLLARYTSVL